MKLSRRTLIRATAATLAAPAFEVLIPPPFARAAPAAPGAPAGAWQHGLSLFGEPKYPPGFKHYDYVNPQAPVGGTVRLSAFGTFDNFNQVISGIKGTLANGLNLIGESLTTPARDEVSTVYGLLAEAVRYPADRSSVTYRLRAIARWHDGKPVTPEDVIWSFQAFTQNDPQWAGYYKHVKNTEKTGEREVTFHFDGPGNRELPQIVGQLPILPKHWWEGTGKNGKKRDVTQTTLEPPLGSGPYKLKEFSAGRTIVYERLDDYWGKDLNVMVGTNNFDIIRYEYYRNSMVALQGFKGDSVDWRTESVAKNWATNYKFPAVHEKKVLLEKFRIRSSGGMQAFAFNIRRDKFKSPHLRRAFNYAFDFEWMNKQLFYGEYRRNNSYFDGLELASSGVPEGQERDILMAVQKDLLAKMPQAKVDGFMPPELFAKPYTNPVAGSPVKARQNLRHALGLLHKAGYVVENTRLVNAKTKEPLTVELLTYDPSLERVMSFYEPSLKHLGIGVSVRPVDSAQYVNRVRQWDFDIIIYNWGETLTPGNEQRDFWSSAAADSHGSQNVVGIKNPAVDELINRVIYAKDRPGLVASTRALDRVLLWNYYVVPQWNYPFQRTARWDRFDHPANMPKYGAAAFPDIWWWDKAKAAKLPQRS